MMNESLNSRGHCRNINGHASNRHAISLFEAMSPSTIGCRNFPRRIIWRRGNNAHLVTAQSKRLAKLSVVFCDPYKIGAVVYSNHEYSHRRPEQKVILASSCVLLPVSTTEAPSKL